MDNNIFSTFNTNHLSDILIDNNLVGGNDSSLFQYVIIIAIISLVIIVIYYLPYKKEIFNTTPAPAPSPSPVPPILPILPIQSQSQVSLEQISNIEKELQEIKSNLSELKPQPQPQPPLQYVSRGRMFDPIAVYDYRKLYDPLVDPRGRTSADEIPTLDVALQLNIPTQGFPDTYHRVGLLIQSNGPPKRGKKNLRTRNGTSLSIDGSSLSSDGSSLSSDGSTSSGSTYSYDRHTVNGENNILELVGKKMGHNWYRYFTSISIGNKIIKINVNNRNRKELYDDDKVYIPELSKWYRVKIDRMDMIDYSPYNLY